MCNGHVKQQNLCDVLLLLHSEEKALQVVVVLAAETERMHVYCKELNRSIILFWFILTLSPETKFRKDWIFPFSFKVS